MSGISPVVTNTIPILPPTSADGTTYVSGFTLAMTSFVLGTIFMIIVIAWIFIVIFGQPMSVAKNSMTQGSIIQHFNTSKSAQMKVAAISGGAFRYGNIRDGTVAATTGSVNNVGGRNIVLTFAQLGVTIPIPILGGISVLVHNGINNINELRRKMTYTEIYKEKRMNLETDEEEVVEVGRKEKIRNEEIISGYNFEDFDSILKESQEEKLIPLVIESVPEFVERNISADLTEKKIKIRQMLNVAGEPDNEHLKIITIAIAVAIVLIIGMFVK